MEDKYGISLDSSLLFSGCSLAELLDQVAKEVAEKEGTGPAAAAKPVSSPFCVYSLAWKQDLLRWQVLLQEGLLFCPACLYRVAQSMQGVQTHQGGHGWDLRDAGPRCWCLPSCRTQHEFFMLVLVIEQSW